MARLDDFPTQVLQQTGRKTLIQKISITTSAARTNLSSTTLTAAMYGAPNINVASGATIMLQSDVNFWYSPCPASATTAVTNYSSTNPGVAVLAGQQEYLTLKGDGASPPAYVDGALDLIGSASGTVAVFLVE